MAILSVKAEIGIAAPPEAVWRVMTDPLRESAWMRAVERAEFLGEPGYRAGARMRRSGRFMGKRMVWESEIAACEPPRRLAFRHVSGPLRGESRWEIDPAPGGSAVRLVTEGPLPRGLGILRPLAATAARLALRADLKRLQSLVARGA